MAKTSPADAPGPSTEHDGPLERVADAAEAVVDAIKPRLRGWIHAGTFPVALVASIVLVVLAPPVAGKVSTAIFGLKKNSSQASGKNWVLTTIPSPACPYGLGC